MHAFFVESALVEECLVPPSSLVDFIVYIHRAAEPGRVVTGVAAIVMECWLLVLITL